MSNKTLAELKARFETGDQPTGQDFVDLIDSLSGLNTENFPDPLPAVGGQNLKNVPIPDPLPAASAENLYNVIADEWQVITDQVNYVDANNFNIVGDWTSKFYKTRRLRLSSGGVHLYTTASDWAYDAGNDLTTVTLTDPLPNNTLEEAAFSLFTPTKEGGAITPDMLGLQASFSVFPSSPASMSPVVTAGLVWDGQTLVSGAQQVVGPFVAPVNNPRIDRVVLNKITGVASVIHGEEAAAPTAPEIRPTDLGDPELLPLARIFLAAGAQAITGDDITDERASWVLKNQDAPVGSAMLWFGDTPPTGWLEQDGSLRDMTTYEALLDSPSVGVRFGKDSGTVVTFDNTIDSVLHAAHGYNDGKVVMLSNSGGAVPAELAMDTKYFVVNATADAYQVSLTKGGAPVAFTDDGTGTSYEHTRLRLLDARGRNIRVWDHGAGVDPDAASRTDRGDGTTGDHPGTLQADALQNITGMLRASAFVGTTSYVASSGAFYQDSYFNSSFAGGGGGTNTGGKYHLDASRVVRTSTESRGINVGAMLIVKHRP